MTKDAESKAAEPVIPITNPNLLIPHRAESLEGKPEIEFLEFDPKVKIPNKVIEQFLPPVGTPFRVGPGQFVVCYHNPGKRRFSARLVGVYRLKESEGGEGEKH